MTSEDPSATALIEEIYEAFRNVTREGGVSWSEAHVIDMYGSMEERDRARRQDKDKSWTELVTTDWTPDAGIGGFIFLDPIGCRYYLPAAMVFTIRNDYSDLDFHLALDDADVRHWSGSRWSMLNERQRDCVKDFIEYMVEAMTRLQNEHCAKDWLDVLASGWDRIYGTPIAEPEALPPSSPPNPLKGA